MRIVKRKVRFGFLATYYSYDADSFFDWDDSTVSVIQRDVDATSTGNYASVWHYPFTTEGTRNHYYLGIRPDYYSGWSGEHNKESNKVEWNVMEDGTYVSVSMPSINNSIVDVRGQCLYDAEDLDYFRPTDVTIDGNRYTIRPMTIGYRRSNGSYVVNAAAGDQDEYYQYILCSDDPTTSAWGNYTSIQRKMSSSPSDYSKQLFRNTTDLDDISVNSQPGNLSNYVAMPGVSTGRKYKAAGLILRLIAIPDAYWATLAAKKADLGKKTGAFSFDVTLGHKTDATVPEFIAIVGGKSVVNEKAAKVGAKRIAIDKATFDGLPVGKNTISVKAKNAAGHVTEASVTFTKVDAFVELRGKPVEHDGMPRKCAIVKSEVLGRGATSSWWVSNNAADASPTWEVYAGGIHEFANKSKTAAKWAVAWKCSIGGAAATTRSELIKQVGMAIM